MQNVRPTDLAPADEHLSLVSAAIDRVVAIAPAQLLPGEKRTDYVDVALRIVRAAQPRDAIEEFLVRDAVDLTWEVLRLRRVKAGILRASMGWGVHDVLAGLGLDYTKGTSSEIAGPRGTMPRASKSTSFSTKPD